MTGNVFNIQAERLVRILASEKELLLTGRAREAVALMEEKLGALQELETALDDPELNAMATDHRQQIQTIVALAKENAIHFEAIRNGLRHAIDRLESLHGNAYVGSYGQDGGKIPFTDVTGQFQRKA
ncbi:hypothetical protein [Hyphomonas johnsonii]|uniref:FlgN family protein n=1 Tax=Hyphomonas johnsonii MHS-2 TaxID=1280950 RepID=A0A059FNG4_9PROT|nr:hypothetical protein [Hyphomonas johnsonii]KCZ92230.1 hypothetical protein HJO_09349 [Hyphomonas johnsonii MHS-2]